MTVDDERPGFDGGQRRQACRYRTLHCHTQEPVRLCRRNRQSHRYWYLLFDFVTCLFSSSYALKPRMVYFLVPGYPKVVLEMGS